jgi:zinc protease
MRFRNTLVSCGVALALAPTFAVAQQAQSTARQITSVEGITEYALPNGLRVLLFPDQSKPTATINITYLVGSRHEGYGEAGMAHLLEHLVFKGTPKHPDIPKELTDHGSRPNGTTSYDRTNYFETVPATEENIDWALDLEADRMINSFIAEKDLKSEFSVVRNEFESSENNPIGVTVFRTVDAAYTWHNYGRSVIGNKADIESVPIDRLKAFYRRYYQPDNAVLVVAGKFEPAKTLALIEKKFGAIPKPVRSMENGNLLHATYTQEPAQEGERFVEVRRVGDAQVLTMVYHTPAGPDPDFPAVQVLNHALTNNPSGRLYKALVEGKLAASIASFIPGTAEPGFLAAFAQLRLNQSVDSARRVMAAVIDTSRKFTEEEVNRAKVSLLRNIELTLQNSEFVGLTLTEWAAQGDWRLMFLNRDLIERVTPADVDRVARAYLKPSNRTVGVFIPTQLPDRATIARAPDVQKLVGNYKGREAMSVGETFDASPANIDSRTKRYALPNGLQVQLLPKETRGDRVVANLILRHGTVQTLQGKGQIASITNAMLSRGTTALTRQQFNDSLAKLKVQWGIFGATNSVQASIQTTRDNFIPALELIAQALRSPRFDAQEFETYKRQQLAQIEQNKQEPQLLAQLALNRRLQPFPKGHVLYTSMPDEQVADINAVTLDQVKAFHREFYGASFGDISVVGDMDEAKVRAAIASTLGSWRSPQPFSRAVRTYAAVDSTLEKILTPDKANATFVAGQNIQLKDDDPDYPALLLGNFMLGGGFLNSRLATRLRQKEGISYGVGSQLSVQAQDRFGQHLTFAILNPTNVDRLTAAYREELDKVIAEGFTEAEVSAAKSGYVQGRSQARANDPELVGLLITRRFAGRTMAYDDKLEKDIMALTPAQVNAAMKKYLDPKKTVIIQAGDFKPKLTP